LESTAEIPQYLAKGGQSGGRGITTAQPLVATWEVLLDAFVTSALDSRSTRVAYRYALAEAGRVLGVTHLHDLTGLMLARYRAWVLEQRWAPGFQALKISALRSFLRWTRALGAHDLNSDVLAACLRVPRSSVVVPYEALGDAEAAALVAVASTPRDRALLLVMLGAGLRVSEVVALDCGDLLAGDPPVLHVRQGKGRKDRVVPLRPGVATALFAQRAGDRGPLFVTNRDGLRLRRRAVEEEVRRLVLKAGIGRRITPHSLRHTFAIRAFRHGGEVLAISKLLGHSSMATTLRYLDHLHLPDLAQSLPPDIG